jgi:glycosyltransferase involved in cell wall biosynthesis
MNRIPLVSIALCTFNGQAYLQQQLDTLVGQSYKNLEIVVVDDASTDSTYAILQKYAAQFTFFKVYKNETNLGFIANFERAVKFCSGELIALCDQDDLWDLQKIELQVAAIGDNVFIYHDSEFIHEDGVPMNKKMSDLMNLYRGDDPLAFMFFNCVSGHTILMKKKLLDAALPLKKGYFHDWWLAYVATNTGAIDFVPLPLVKYRQHDKSETNILRLEREKDNYRLSSIEKYEKTLNWLSNCRSFKANRDQALVEEFYESYKQRENSYFSFRFGILLLMHWKSVFFMRKKSAVSKLNFIRKQFLGVKTKKLLNGSWMQ